MDERFTCETKIDFSSPSIQFQLEFYSTVWRLDRNTNGASNLLYIEEDISSRLPISDL